MVRKSSHPDSKPPEGVSVSTLSEMSEKIAARCIVLWGRHCEPESTSVATAR
jgi:hypothetical protein